MPVVFRGRKILEYRLWSPKVQDPAHNVSMAYSLLGQETYLTLLNLFHTTGCLPPPAHFLGTISSVDLVLETLWLVCGLSYCIPNPSGLRTILAFSGPLLLGSFRSMLGCS
jgi:hypothetical protein